MTRISGPWYSRGNSLQATSHTDHQATGPLNENFNDRTVTEPIYRSTFSSPIPFHPPRPSNTPNRSHCYSPTHQPRDSDSDYHADDASSYAASHATSPPHRDTTPQPPPNSPHTTIHTPCPRPNAFRDGACPPSACTPHHVSSALLLAHHTPDGRNHRERNSACTYFSCRCSSIFAPTAPAIIPPTVPSAPPPS